MYFNYLYKFLIIVFVYFQVQFIYSQYFPSVSLTALNYLNLPKNAINASLANTPSFLFYNNGNRFINPALGISDYDNSINQLSIHFTPLAWYWIVDEGKGYMMSINYSKSFSARQTLSSSIEYLDHGSLNLIDENFNFLGKNLSYELNINMNYSYRIKKKLSVGIGATYLVSSLASINVSDPFIHRPTRTSKVVFNTGANYEKSIAPNSVLNFGIAFLNLGSKISYNKTNFFFIPSKMNIYANWYNTLNKDHLLSLTFQSSKSLIPISSAHTYEEIINDNILTSSNIYNKGFLTAWGESFSDYGSLDNYLRSSQNSLALEYLYQRFLRGAISLQYQENSYGARFIYNFGVGVMVNNISVQMAYENPLLFDKISRYPNAHTIRLSLLYTWSNKIKNKNLLCPKF